MVDMKIEITPERKSKGIFVLICAGVSLLTYLGTFILTPGYLHPFLLNKYWLAITFSLLGWQALGSLLVFIIPAIKRLWILIILRIMFVLVFVCPNILLPILGPFIATCCYIPGEFGRIIKSIFSWF